MKKRNKILCGFLVLSLIIGTAVPSRATIKDEKDKLNNLQNEQEDVQQQINGLEKSKADAKTFINTVDSQVSAISKQMYDNENELDKTEKKIKKNARYTAGRISGNRPSRTPKEAVIALPPFSFRKNGNACPNTGAMSTGIKSSE